MTAKKDLKRRIRERQQRTGESYVVARRAVLAEQPEADESVAVDDTRGSPDEAAARAPASDHPRAPDLLAFPSPAMREAASVLPEMGMPEKGGIEVVEMDDITAEATGLGFKCTISISKHLTERIEPRLALGRFRDVLLGTTANPLLEPMRGVAFRNERPPHIQLTNDWWTELRHFVTRVRAGIGGVSVGGTMLAVHVESKTGPVMMVCHLGFGIANRTRPRIVLTTVDAAAFHVEPIALRMLNQP